MGRDNNWGQSSPLAPGAVTVHCMHTICFKNDCFFISDILGNCLIFKCFMTFVKCNIFSFPCIHWIHFLIHWFSSKIYSILFTHFLNTIITFKKIKIVFKIVCDTQALLSLLLIFITSYQFFIYKKQPWFKKIGSIK